MNRIEKIGLPPIGTKESEIIFTINELVEAVNKLMQDAEPKVEPGTNCHRLKRMYDADKTDKIFDNVMESVGNSINNHLMKLVIIDLLEDLREQIRATA